jgi:hypothetical protein
MATSTAEGGRHRSRATRILPDETDEYVSAWFGATSETAVIRLWPFAHTGGEGSMAALWLDEVGVTRIVHLGSGSGSMLTCVLAEDQVDFLRLLAIGYTEICWNQEFTSPPKPWWDDYAVENRPFRTWFQRRSTRRSPPQWLWDEVRVGHTRA